MTIEHTYGQQTIIDALTAQIETLKDGSKDTLERIEEVILGAFPHLKRRENQTTYGLVGEACNAHRQLAAEHARAMDTIPTFDINGANRLVEENRTLRERLDSAHRLEQKQHDQIKAVREALAATGHSVELCGYTPADVVETLARRLKEAEATNRRLLHDAERLEADIARSAEMCSTRSALINKIDQTIRSGGYDDSDSLESNLEAALADARLGRTAREDAELESRMPDIGRFSKSTMKEARKNLTRANADLAEIRRLVKAHGKESALEAVRRHFGEFKDEAAKRHNIGSFFKTLREMLGIPVQDHGGLERIIKAVRALTQRLCAVEEERDTLAVLLKSAESDAERLAANQAKNLPWLHTDIAQILSALRNATTVAKAIAERHAIPTSNDKVPS